MSNRSKTTAIILAAGVGSRMRADITKQKMLVLGRSIVSRSVGAFFDCDAIDAIVVVGREEELDYLKAELAPYSSKIVAIVMGGSTRFESARRGFEAIPEDTAYVAIHDAARPLVTDEIITSVVKNAIEYGAATDAMPVYDTVKAVDSLGCICATLDRRTLALARTPQAFRVDIYSRALNSFTDGEGITDDNMLVESIGVSVRAVMSDKPNPKITTPADIRYAEFLLTEGKGNV